MEKKARGNNRKRPAVGSAEYERHRSKVISGMRAARKRRRNAGLLLPVEVAALYALPLPFVKRSMNAGELRVLQSGQRRYIRAESAELLYGVRGKLERSA
jgi:hypothetical protein